MNICNIAGTNIFKSTTDRRYFFFILNSSNYKNISFKRLNEYLRKYMRVLRSFGFCSVEKNVVFCPMIIKKFHIYTDILSYDETVCTYHKLFYF